MILKSNYTVKIIVVYLVIFMFSCYRNHSQTQNDWSRNESETTTKIKYTTELHGKNLMRKILDQIVHMHFIVDTNSLNPMKTLPTTINSVEMRFRVDFDDSIFTMSGQFANPNNDLLHPNASLNWKSIQKGGGGVGNARGYEIFKSIGDRISHTDVQYNK